LEAGPAFAAISIVTSVGTALPALAIGDTEPGFAVPDRIADFVGPALPARPATAVGATPQAPTVRFADTLAVDAGPLTSALLHQHPQAAFFIALPLRLELALGLPRHTDLPGADGLVLHLGGQVCPSRQIDAGKFRLSTGVDCGCVRCKGVGRSTTAK